MDWNDLRYLLAVADTGTLSGAARRLKVDQTTVGRRIAALEQALGGKLFERTSDGFALTHTGEQALELARGIDERFGAIEARVSGMDQRLAGTVRIATSENFSIPFLLHRLLLLRRRHPDIELEIITGATSVNLLRREADLAVRLGPHAHPTQQNLVARKLGDVAWAVYASGDYLAGHPPLRVEDGLAGHALVTYDDDMAAIPPARWLVDAGTAARSVARVNTILAAGIAAADGVGVAVIPCFLATSHPALVRALPGVVASSEAWLVVHPDLQRTARVRAVVEHIVRIMDDNAAFLRGETATPATLL